jgi:hypothetical protein
MKALTLHEPFATLIAHGFKEVETRGWYTSYRGPLAIHAATRRQNSIDLSRVNFALAARGFELPAPTFGAVVCTCTLAACVPAGFVILRCRQLKPPFTPARGWEFETQFGDYTGDRWAWILRDVLRFDRPAAALGSQKLWDWEPKK